MIGGAKNFIDSVRNYRNAIFGSDVELFGLIRISCAALRKDRPDSALNRSTAWLRRLI